MVRANTPERFLHDYFGAAMPPLPAETAARLALADPIPAGARDSVFAALPPDHRRLLDLANGLDLLGGSYRLFGLGPGASRDLRGWNAPGEWKFAWGGRADPWLCFGESALGHQYAYPIAEIEQGDRCPVSELFVATLEPVVTYPSFRAFLVDGFLAGIHEDAYHQRIRSIRQQMGVVPLDKQVAYMPSPLLTGGRTDVQNLVPLDARAAMIINGDLYRQLAHRDSLDGLQRVETYRDDMGRERLLCVFA